VKATALAKALALAAVGALVFGACSAAPGSGTGSTIKIGGGFALTGDESALDLPAANGAKLAVKEINAAGGVLGKQIEFIVHDSQYKMDVTAQTAKQFVEQDKVPLSLPPGQPSRTPRSRSSRSARRRRKSQSRSAT
jgi:branched-chain amino acid transport system substrate-binding protein